MSGSGRSWPASTASPSCRPPSPSARTEPSPPASASDPALEQRSLPPVLFDDRQHLPALAPPGRQLLGPCLRRSLERPNRVLPVESRRRARLAARGGQKAQDLVSHRCGRRAEVEQDANRDSLALTHQTEQDVLGTDVVVAEVQRLPQRQLE